MRFKRLFTVSEGEKVTENALRRVLISSICSILICMTCLAGTTWAWFTVTIENNNNVIQIAEEWGSTSVPEDIPDAAVSSSSSDASESDGEQPSDTNDETESITDQEDEANGEQATETDVETGSMTDQEGEAGDGSEGQGAGESEAPDAVAESVTA